MFQKATEPILELRRVSQFALPDHQSLPAKGFQIFQRYFIPPFVARNFIDPVSAVIGWDASSAGALVSVPEASVDEDNFAKPGERKVGFAGEIFAVQPESKPHGMRHSTDLQLGSGIPILHGPHSPATFF